MIRQRFDIDCLNCHPKFVKIFLHTQRQKNNFSDGTNPATTLRLRQRTGNIVSCDGNHHRDPPVRFPPSQTSFRTLGRHLPKLQKINFHAADRRHDGFLHRDELHPPERTPEV
jgi:hypothetical protein